MWGQYQGTEFKKNRNIAKESHAPVKKEIKNLKTKILDHNSKCTFCIWYDCLDEERMKSFNTTFKQMETNEFYKIF